MQISVLMPVFNGGRFLREAVESVLAQTFTDFEFLIVNDGSTDSSMSILREYAKADSRIVLAGGNRIGLVASLNAGLAMARADLVARFDADDRMLPNRLERQLSYLNENPELSVACSRAHLIDVNGKRIGRSAHSIDVQRGRRELKPSLFLEVVHPSVLMRKDVIIRLGGYRETPLEDRDLWGRLITSGYLIGCQEEYLMEYRLHGTSTTLRERDRPREELIDFNVVRRLKGEPELSYDMYVAYQQQRPLLHRLRSRVTSSSMAAYKNATRHYAERRMVKCAGLFLCAVMLRPLWTINRMRVRLSGLDH